MCFVKVVGCIIVCVIRDGVIGCGFVCLFEVFCVMYVWYW